MPVPVYGAPELAAALYRLFPRGVIYDGPVWQNFRTGLVQGVARLSQACADLIGDTRPDETVFLLPAWESTLGLPDPCAGPAPTLQRRQALALSRFVGGAGPTIAALIGYAATLGYAVTITEFAPARAGQFRAGQPLYGVAWAHAWRIGAPLNTVAYFRAGSSAAGEPLASWGNTVLECQMREIAPAHTVVQFVYA